MLSATVFSPESVRTHWAGPAPLCATLLPARRRQDCTLGQVCNLARSRGAAKTGRDARVRPPVAPSVGAQPTPPVDGRLGRACRPKSGKVRRENHPGLHEVRDGFPGGASLPARHDGPPKAGPQSRRAPPRKRNCRVVQLCNYPSEGDGPLTLTRGTVAQGPSPVFGLSTSSRR